MREVLVRPRAQSDLESIWLYTFDRWDEEQATRYLRKVNDRIAELAAEPERGKSQEAIRPGYYSARIGRHVIYYTFTDQSLGIERVLHDQMDFDRHL